METVLESFVKHTWLAACAKLLISWLISLSYLSCYSVDTDSNFKFWSKLLVHVLEKAKKLYWLSG